MEGLGVSFLCLEGESRHVPECRMYGCLEGSLYHQKFLCQTDTLNDGQAGLIYFDFPSCDARRVSLR